MSDSPQQKLVRSVQAQTQVARFVYLQKISDQKILERAVKKE